jgi:hypothetical protein
VCLFGIGTRVNWVSLADAYFGNHGCWGIPYPVKSFLGINRIRKLISINCRGSVWVVSIPKDFALISVEYPKTCRFEWKLPRTVSTRISPHFPQIQKMYSLFRKWIHTSCTRPFFQSWEWRKYNFNIFVTDIVFDGYLGEWNYRAIPKVKTWSCFLTIPWWIAVNWDSQGMRSNQYL